MTINSDFSRHRMLQVSSLTLAVVFSASGVSMAVESGEACDPRDAMHFELPANIETVQQGFFSPTLEPLITVNSGDFVTIELVTHHSDKDPRMIEGDEGVESIFAERASGHILTGPVEVCGAEPGDVLEVRILDLYPRASKHPDATGRTFGANLATGGGFLDNALVAEEPLVGDGEPRALTIYEVDASRVRTWARADYSYPVGGSAEDSTDEVLKDVRVPIRPHIGILAVTPNDFDRVISGPPAYFGGNIDDWRIGKGATMYYPVVTPGALLVAGDPHAAQGDSELSGTAIEMSLTGTLQLILHKQDEAAGTILEGLNYPLLETDEEFVVHGFSFPNYLTELGADPQEAQDTIYQSSSLDQAMYDAATKMVSFLTGPMGLTFNEAYSLMSVAIDFGVTQVVDGNWGVHATLSKSMMGDLDVLGSYRK